MNIDVLTETQRRVYDRLVLGDSNQEIATTLGIVEKTVKAHVTGIFKTFACTTRTKLIARHYLERT